jgi:hypothetical protein
MAFNHKHNTDNVFSRAVIVGLVNLLNNKIQFVNVLSDTEQDVIEVPWFFNQAGDERFMQDYFTFWSDCVHPKLSDGNYDVIPRGNATLTGESINSSMLTHRFVRGKRVKEIDGQLHTFNGYLNSIPLTLSFDCTIKTDTHLDALKIQQTIRELFYKVQVFQTSYDGFRIPCQVGFPEDIGLEKTFEYSYGDDTTCTLSFSLELETYQPVMDKSTERHESNRMQGFAPNINASGTPNASLSATVPRSLSIINPTDKTILVPPQSPEIYYSGSHMVISWESTGPILRNDIYYTTDTGTNWIPIQKIVTNSGSYVWEVPNFQTSYPSAIFSQDPSINAKVRAIVDGGGQISSIIVFEGGLGYNNNLKVEIEEPGFTGTLAEVEPIVTNGSITSFNIISGGSGYTPTQQITLGLKIEDSNNQNISSTVQNILIT